MLLVFSSKIYDTDMLGREGHVWQFLDPLNNWLNLGN